jgi:hypothetical protein
MRAIFLAAKLLASISLAQAGPKEDAQQVVVKWSMHSEMVSGSCWLIFQAAVPRSLGGGALARSKPFSEPRGRHYGDNA